MSDVATAANVDSADNQSTDTSNTAVNVPVQKRKVGRPPNDPNTKLAQAKAMFPELVTEKVLTRSEILDVYQNELGVTKGTAQVYFHAAKNAHPTLTVTKKAKVKSVKAPVTAQADATPDTAGGPDVSVDTEETSD